MGSGRLSYIAALVNRTVVRFCLFGAVVAGACGGLWGAGTAAWAEQQAPRFAVERYRLDNGLEIMLHEDHTVAQAYVSIWYHAGGGDDLPGRSGLAHFCEHMMFEGSAHVAPSEHLKRLRLAGNADANATTGADRTNYYQTVPPEQLETALWLESDRMSYLTGSLREDRFDDQRDVVRNERRQSYENVAFGRELFVIAEALYPEGHPYRPLTIGRHEDLQAATLDDARAFFRQWYRPSNATLFIGGDFASADVKALVNKWFATLPGTVEKPIHRSFPAPVLSGRQRLTVVDPFTKLRRLHYVWPTARFGTDDDLGLDVLALVLAKNPTGRLWKQLVYSGKPVAQSVSAYQSSRSLGSEFHIVIDLRPDASLDEADRLAMDALAFLKTGAVGTREVRQVFTAFEVQMASGYETVSARGEAMQSFNQTYGDPNRFGWRLDTIRQNTPGRLGALARRYLGDGRLEVVTMPAGTAP
jgi:predicted Zn-dependent peptidase